jgi:hypothetical protein
LIRAQKAHSSIKQGFLISLIILIVIPTTALLVPYTLVSENKEKTQFYVGVTLHACMSASSLDQTMQPNIV